MRTKIPLLTFLSVTAAVLASEPSNLAQEKTSVASEPILIEQLATARLELARLREHRSDEHPSVINQLRNVAELEKRYAVDRKDLIAGERFDVPILKVFAVKDGEALFRAYLVKWKDQDVVVKDPYAKTKFKEGDIIAILVSNVRATGGSSQRQLAFALMNP